MPATPFVSMILSRASRCSSVSVTTMPRCSRCATLADVVTGSSDNAFNAKSLRKVAETARSSRLWANVGANLSASSAEKRLASSTLSGLGVKLSTSGSESLSCTAIMVLAVFVFKHLPGHGRPPYRACIPVLPFLDSPHEIQSFAWDFCHFQLGHFRICATNRRSKLGHLGGEGQSAAGAVRGLTISSAENSEGHREASGGSRRTQTVREQRLAKRSESSRRPHLGGRRGAQKGQPSHHRPTREGTRINRFPTPHRENRAGPAGRNQRTSCSKRGNTHDDREILRRD